MSIPDLSPLGIHPGQSSKRLFFGKMALNDTVWHILDFGMSRATGIVGGQGHECAALHGHFMAYDPDYADTIDEVIEKGGIDSYICDGCLHAFSIAADTIAANPMLRFSIPQPKSLIIQPDQREIDILGKQRKS